MSTHPTSEDEDLDFINSLPSALDTALNDNGSGSINFMFTKESSRFSRTKTLRTSFEPKEEVADRHSISTLSNISDGEALLPTSSNSQTPTWRKSRKWVARSANFWRQNRGLCEVFFSQILSALVNTTTRLLETEDQALPPVSVLFIRMGLTMFMGTAYMWFNHIPILGQRQVWGLLHLRGILGFWSIVGFLYSLKYLPLSDATVLTFLAPSVTGYTSHLLLHSPFTRPHQIASFVALAGVLLIARPSSFFSDDAAQAKAHVAPTELFKFMFASTNCNGTTSSIVARSALTESTSSTQRLIAVGVALLGVLGSGGSYTIIRGIGTRTHPLVSMNYFAAYSTLFSGLILVFGLLINSPDLTFTLPSSLRQISMLLFISAVGFLVQLLLTLGLAREKSNRATDMIYTNMLWALLLDKLVFGSIPGWSSVVGSLLILGSAIFGFAAAGGKGASGDQEQRGSIGDMDEIDDDDEVSEERILLDDMGV